MLEDFKKHIETNFRKLQEQEFLIACSGGLDSVVLTHLCKALELNFSLAHCNFNLRGDDSNLDEKFVRNLAKNINVRIDVKSFETDKYIAKNKVSLQMAARELRYAWFADIMNEKGIKTLVTGHHLDDNLETFIINLSRGTGIDGLTSIPKKTPTISRPLLAFSKEQILKYATENNLNWREDKSNQETKYLRNKIRHKIVPELKELHPTFLINFSKTQNYLDQTSVLLDGLINEKREIFFQKEGNLLRIDIQSLEKLEPQEPFIFELFKPFGFADATAIIDLCSSMSGKELFSTSHRLLKNRTHLLLQEINQEIKESYFIQKNEIKMVDPFMLSVFEVKKVGETHTSVVYVDADLLQFPLEVRKWKIGDYFHPFGMKGVKKVSKYFKDEKYSLIDKENQWLLCSEDKIIWVIGKRADDRFKVTEKTKNIIAITNE